MVTVGILVFLRNGRRFLMSYWGWTGVDIQWGRVPSGQTRVEWVMMKGWRGDEWNEWVRVRVRTISTLQSAGP